MESVDPVCKIAGETSSPIKCDFQSGGVKTIEKVIDETASRDLEQMDISPAQKQEETEAVESLQKNVTDADSSSAKLQANCTNNKTLNTQQFQTIDSEAYIFSLTSETVVSNDNPKVLQMTVLDENSQDSLFVEKKSLNIESVYPESFKMKGMKLYSEVTGPYIYKVTGDTVSRQIIMKNLPAAFEGLPVTGHADSGDKIIELQDSKLKQFVGGHFTDEEFKKLASYCSIEHMKTGDELVMPSNIPACGIFVKSNPIDMSNNSDGELYVNKRYRMREDPEYDSCNLKYRGVRIIPPPKDDSQSEDASSSDEVLEPGKDLIFRVRIYRPYPSTKNYSVCQCDVVMNGRQPLWQLRDRVVCTNDLDMRVDISHNPDLQQTTTAKDVFPSGYFFINNVFYVDTRAGCRDLAAPVRRWARARGLGDLPTRTMDECCGDLELRLGHPEVYIHQGNCEHIFTFSSVRLVNPTDPLRLGLYPYSTMVTSNHTVYCTTCAEFGAKWIVTGSNRVPFDPAFFCDTCLRLYMYKDGQKIGDFKAFAYRGNELNVLKPM